MKKYYIAINPFGGSKDGLEISTKSWLPKRKPKAIVQIVHGMSEHAGRYHDFASELVKNKYGVYS